MISFAVETVITLFTLFVLAAIMHACEIESKYASAISSIGLAVGTFFGGYIYSGKRAQNGLINGILIAFALFLPITVISLIFCNVNFGFLTFLHLLIMLLSGAIGGIFGVNFSKKIKI
jgi:putative membrane protein (TIGR04086 family)